MNEINYYKNTFFDYLFYINHYDDLKKKINTEEQAWFHVLNHGWKENRVILEDLKKNNQLINLLYNNEKEIEIKNGNNGYLNNYIFKKLPKNFNYKHYLELNPRLKNNFSDNEYCSIKHYINHIKNDKIDFINKDTIFLKENYINSHNNTSLKNNTPSQNKKKILIVYHVGSINYNFTYNIINYLTKYDIRYNFNLYITINEEFTDNNNLSNKLNNLKRNLLDNDNHFGYFNIKYIKNIGADIYPFFDFVSNLDNLNLPENIDYILKLHTKQNGYPTFRLCSIFHNLKEIFDIFDSDENIGIIGEKRFLLPIYYSLSDEYSLKMNYILKYLFKFETKCYSDEEYLKILNHFSLNEINFDKKKYYESKIDLFKNKNFTINNCYNHFNNHKLKELNHYGYNLNDCNVEKVITGTIFIMRYDILKKINSDLKNELKQFNHYIEKYENITYFSNFDDNGKIFRYTNAGEYIIQSLIYKYNKYCYGYELKNKQNYINHSICLNSINERFIKHYEEYNIDDNKENILFITNELSKTGAPIVLKNILLYLQDHYNIFIISLYEGDDKDYYTSNNYFFFSLFKDYTRLGIDIFERNVNFIYECVLNIVKPKIMYCNTFVSNFAIYGSMKLSKKPYIILHIHEAEDEIINLINNSHLISFDFLKYCDLIITVNEFIYRFINSLYKLNKKNILTIYNDICIDKNKINKNINFISEKTKIDVSNYTLTFGGSGSLNYRKGFDIFYNCSLNYPNFLFIWASNNKQSMIKTNFNIIDIPNNLKIINLEKDEMNHFYKNIDYFLYTSRSEAFPLTFFELIYVNTNILLCKKTLPFEPDFFKKSNIECIGDSVNYDNFNKILMNLTNHNYKLNKNINLKYILTLINNNTKKIIKILNYIHNNCKTKINKNNFHDIQLYEVELYKKINLYDFFLNYGIQKDLLQYRDYNNIDNNLSHYLNSGFSEGRYIYRLPSLIKKTILFAFHELSFNGATRVGLDIASKLQTDYNIIIISQIGGNIINEYFFENPIIIINNRTYEYDLIKYIERKELAENIIKIINPDLVYITSSVIHYFYHACCDLKIKTIYHLHEGINGYNSQLNGNQIPIDNFHNYFDEPNKENILYYSPSPLTTHIMINNIKINKNNIKQFQLINFLKIDSYINNNVFNGDKSFLNNEQKNIGMVGLSSYRKGFDIFYKLAQKNNHLNFIWVGYNRLNDSKINHHMIINKPSNLYLIHETNNPYFYINHFDYFLCTSREDLGPLVIIESLYLDIPTIYLKDCISLDTEFKKIGAYSIDKNYEIESFQYIIDKLYVFKKNTNKELLLDYYSFEKNIENIKSDIHSLLTTKISFKTYDIEKYNVYDNKIISFNMNKINKKISKHHKKSEYNEIIFKNKYKFLYDYFIKKNMNIELIYDKYISNRLNCLKDDWKLFIVLNKDELFKNGIISKNDLDNNICNYNYKNLKYEIDFNKYKKKFSDLEHLNDNKIINHFYNNGIYENRYDF